MIGRLSERITLQTLGRTDDGMGGAVEAWANISSVPTVWAAVRPARAGETFTADRLESHGMYEFTVRHRSDINESMSISWRGSDYRIRSVQRVEGRSMYLKIWAERG